MRTLCSCMMLRNRRTIYIFFRSCVTRVVCRTSWRSGRSCLRVRRWLLLSSWSVVIGICMSIRLFIAIWSRPIFWLRMRLTRLLILVLRSTTSRVRSWTRFTRVWWVVLCTCVLRFWTVVLILRRATFGRWAWYFTRCFTVRLLTRLHLYSSW